MLALKTVRWGLVLVGVAGAVCGVEAAEVYRYRDADGRAVFSDTAPPPGVSAESTLNVPAAAATTVTPASPMAPPMPEPAVAAPANETDAVTAERAKNCEKARDALARLEKSPRLRVKNAEGYTYYMDEDERARRLRAAEASEAAWCSPARTSP